MMSAESNSKKSVSYQMKDGCGHARPSFICYDHDDNDKDLKLCFLLTHLVCSPLKFPRFPGKINFLKLTLKYIFLENIWKRRNIKKGFKIILLFNHHHFSNSKCHSRIIFWMIKISVKNHIIQMWTLPYKEIHEV